ncbi:MAG: SIS domain-containing protein [Gammaproteobacteria bacterium]|nr:SIS domain-containing protein [Gammaproteobacteria bacterium]
MDNYQAIAGGFQETVELITVSVDALVDHLQRASDVCIEALLQEKKILACGNGSGGAVAQIFSTNLLHRFEHERPSLPALSLGTDSATLSAIATSSASNELYSKQVRALGQPGDVLLAVAGVENNGSIIQAIRAAHDRNMLVIVLSGGACGDISSLLLPEDVELHIPSTRAPRIIEMQTMIVHCLSELIDQSLFGSYSP